MKAVISYDYQNKQFRQPEEVETIDITSCIMAIQSLYSISQEVIKTPWTYGGAAEAMAHQIQLIYKVLKPQIDSLKMSSQKNA